MRLKNIQSKDHRSVTQKIRSAKWTLHAKTESTLERQVRAQKWKSLEYESIVRFPLDEI